MEKQYKPDFYGLNLTIATLDGILKHSFLEEGERRLYRDIFNSYQEVFWEKENIDLAKKGKLDEILFEYVSPLTYEGIIVSLADEIAQLCHDIEDLRRLGGFKVVKDFYENVVKEFKNMDLPVNAQKVYRDFCEVFKDIKSGNGEVVKLERLYVKLILNICIPFVTEVIEKLHRMDEDSQEQLLKKKYLGKFENVRELKSKIGLNTKEIRIIEPLDNIFNEYKRILIQLPNVARWDIKGKELCKELARKLCKAFTCKIGEQQDEKINLNILDPEIREDLKKSYSAGEEFIKKNSIPGMDDIAVKFAVWDYLAGMTDSFIIRQYESLTFKRVDLR